MNYFTSLSFELPQKDAFEPCSILINVFSDKLMILITQTGKIATFVLFICFFFVSVLSF